MQFSLAEVGYLGWDWFASCMCALVCRVLDILLQDLGTGFNIQLDMMLFS